MKSIRCELEFPQDVLGKHLVGRRCMVNFSWFESKERA